MQKNYFSLTDRARFLSIKIPFKIPLMLFCLFIIWSASAFRGRTYTINPVLAADSVNYKSFTALANDLKNVTRGDGGPAQYAVGGTGVQGAVVINVAPGTYTQQVKFNQVLGVNATNTVTINGNGAILQFTATSTTDAATLDMDGTDYFTIRNLELRSTGTYGYCIWMHNAADRNKIIKNRFNCPSFTTTTQTAYIWLTNGNTSPTSSYGNSGNFNLIDSNDMRTSATNGPYYGIVIVGPSTAPYAATNACNFNTVSNNNVESFYLYGVYTYYASGLTVKGNMVHNTNVTRYTTKYGLYMYYTSAMIESNRIYNLNGNTPQGNIIYPIYWYNYDNGTNFTNQKVRNNLIHAFSTTSTYSYFYFYTNIANGATLDIENNTLIYAYNSTIANTGTMYGLYGSYWRNVENNIVYNNHGGTGTKYLHYDNGGCNAYTTFKNNNFSYGSGAAGTIYYGRGGTGCSVTSDFDGMLAAGLPTNNLSVDPEFIDLSSNSDLTPTAIGMANKGKVISGLTTDNKGISRSSTPDMGALEYTVDLQVTAFPLVFPTPSCSGFTSSIGGTIKNNSAYTIKNPTMAYMVNNNPKVTYNVPATIAPGASASFTFPGDYKFSVSGNTKVSLFVSTPDDMVANDSMSVSTVITRAPGGSLMSQNTILSSPFAIWEITGKPDLTFPNEKMVYDFTAPSRVGYTNGDYLTKWVGAATAKTVNGYNANAIITTSTTAPFYVTLNPTKAWEDSVIVVSVKMVDFATGCDTTYMRKVLIAPKAVPDFILPNPLCERAEIYFENTTTVTSGIVDYEWNFGDSTLISSDLSPVHTFASSGTYTIVMKAKTSPYNFVTQKSIVVNVKEVPLAKIININKCQGTSIVLGNGTIGGSGSPVYTWSFDDGSADVVTTTATNVSKAYIVPGPHNVTLRATADGCSDIVTKTVYQFAKPVADFSKIAGACLNDEFTFLDNSYISLGIYGNSWNFDDNGNIASDLNPVYHFDKAGIKNIKLKVISEFGCTDSIVKQIVVKQIPTTDFSYPFACSRSATIFNNLTNLNGEVLDKYTWNIGQGAPLNVISPTVNWSQVGPRTVTLKTTLANGCSTEVSKPINVGVQPLADFEYEAKCAGSAIAFTNMTTFSKGVIKYEWDFGDNISSAIAAPVHTYSTTSAQTFFIKLKASIVDGCSDSIVKGITISPLPATCDFSLTRNWAVGNGRNFIYTPTGGSKNGITYTWITGDGNKVTSNGAEANYTYNGNLQYCITMVAKTAEGCECSNTKCVDLNTAINDVNSNRFNIYPNPSNGLFNISSHSDFTVLDVTVYNVVGELVKTVSYNNGSNASLDLTNLNSGVYFVNITDGNISTTQKINIIK